MCEITGIYMHTYAYMMCDPDVGRWRLLLACIKYWNIPMFIEIVTVK